MLISSFLRYNFSGDLVGISSHRVPRAPDQIAACLKSSVNASLPPEQGLPSQFRCIPPVTIEALREHLKKQKQQPLLADTSWKEQGLIFTTRTGTPVDTTNVLHLYQEILKRASLPKMRFYDLRHTHASLLIAEGVHPKKIAERLGHASIKLTMDLRASLRWIGQRIGRPDAEDFRQPRRRLWRAGGKRRPISRPSQESLRRRAGSEMDDA